MSCCHLVQVVEKGPPVEFQLHKVSSVGALVQKGFQSNSAPFPLSCLVPPAFPPTTQSQLPTSAPVWLVSHMFRYLPAELTKVTAAIFARLLWRQLHQFRRDQDVPWIAGAEHLRQSESISDLYWSDVWRLYFKEKRYLVLNDGFSRMFCFTKMFQSQYPPCGSDSRT